MNFSDLQRYDRREGFVAMRVASGIFQSGGGGTADTRLYGLLFAVAAAAFCLHTLIGSQPGAASSLLAIIGNATCAWSWLLVRALFRQPAARRQWWPLAVVAAMVAIGTVVRLSDGNPSPLLRIADNAEGLASSTLLLLAAAEPLRGIGAMLPAERRFRAGFVAGYGALLVIAVLWIDGAPASSETARSGNTVRAFCALAALVGMSFAVWYRAGHPVPDIAKVKRRVQTDDHGLGGRILHAMREERAFTRNDLKLADLANQIGEADYKVTQCITGALGFRNFNQMTNAFRLAEVKRRLADPAFDHLPILTIALDCGFGSIGPFNRTFKVETGTTPKQFRAGHRPL